MYTTTMYQQPMVIQITEPVHQHLPIKERKDNNVSYVKTDIPHRTQQHYQHNNRPGGKKQSQWSNNYKNIRTVTKELELSPSHECLTVQAVSNNLHSDSSSDDSSTKGTKRLHELNGSQQQFVHSYTLSSQFPQAYQTRRTQIVQQTYQTNHKRRYHMNKFGSPPHIRKNKQVTIGANTYEQVPDRYLARSQTVEVRDTPRQLVSGSKWDQLSSDIWHKFIANQQTSENYINKMNLFKRIYSPIKTFLRYSVFIVGSTFNGFGTNTSDLDLCLVVRNQLLHDVRSEAIHHLINTHQLLLQINYTGTEFQKLELIEAKIPLLKFHSWGVDVDINFNNPVGIRNTQLLHCYAKETRNAYLRWLILLSVCSTMVSLIVYFIMTVYSKASIFAIDLQGCLLDICITWSVFMTIADWRVQPLVLVVKLWANAHHINDAKNGTISSYSLALMVIHFLQYGTEPAVLPCLQLDFPEKFKADREIHEINIQETLTLPATSNTQSLGELLLQFFQYYNQFNYSEDAVSVRVGRTLPIEHCRRFPSPKNEPRAWSFLCIEEPFDHTNTARAVYDQEKFEHIRKVFELSYQRLKETHSLDSIFHLKVTT